MYHLADVSPGPPAWDLDDLRQAILTPLGLARSGPCQRHPVLATRTPPLCSHHIGSGKGAKRKLCRLRN